MTHGYLLRCATKGCRHTLRVDVEPTGTTMPDRFGTTRTVDTLADRQRAYEAIPLAAKTCPEHGLGATRNWRPIRGRFSAEHECDGRCLAAIGPDCECSCGGANHGANHAAVSL